MYRGRMTCMPSRQSTKQLRYHNSPPEYSGVCMGEGAFGPAPTANKPPQSAANAGAKHTRSRTAGRPCREARKEAEASARRPAGHVLGR